MKLIPDDTGRFPERPHYETDELEEECERLITSFLERRYGQIVIPVPTDALRVLIEGEAAKLLYADLSHEGEEVHGITEFFPGRRPLVTIARELSVQPWRVHRERTTLTMNSATYTGTRRCMIVTAGRANGTSARADSYCRAVVSATGWSGRRAMSRARC